MTPRSKKEIEKIYGQQIVSIVRIDDAFTFCRRNGTLHVGTLTRAEWRIMSEWLTRQAYCLVSRKCGWMLTPLYIQRPGFVARKYVDGKGQFICR